MDGVWTFEFKRKIKTQERKKNDSAHSSAASTDEIFLYWTNEFNEGDILAFLADGLSSQVTQRATELDHGFLSVVRFFFCYKSR